MTRIFSKRLLLIALAFAGISSCKVAEIYERPEVDTENLYRGSTGQDSSSFADLPWSRVFSDSTLQALIQEGISHNQDIQIAYTRIQQAEAYLKQSRAAFYPSLNANATATINKLSDAQGGNFINNTRIFQLGLSSGWEADLWAKLRSAKRASIAQLLQSQEYSRALQTGLVANIANYYYQLLALDQQLAITQQTARNWASIVETMKTLKNSAVVTGAAVVQSEANQYAAEVTIPDLERRIRETENALSVLLGRNSATIKRASLANQQVLDMLDTGVPAKLLQNRPDIRQAEYNYRYFFENTNVARSYFYPSLNITASGGLSNTMLSNYFSPGSVFASVVAGLAQPVFNKRLNRTRLEVAKAQQQEALLSFQRALLVAGKEVSDALFMYKTASDKIVIREKQITSLQKSIYYTQELLRYGSANYVEVINAQQSYLATQLSSVNDRLQQLQAEVELYRSLGGGWK